MDLGGGGEDLDLGGGDEELDLDLGDEEGGESSDKPFDDEPFDADVEASEEEDPKKYIQQLSGKLGQSMRDFTDSEGQPDFDLEKFAINSVISASHSSEMDEEDQEDIIDKVKSSGEGEEGGGEDLDRGDDEEELDLDLDGGGDEEELDLDLDGGGDGDVEELEEDGERRFNDPDYVKDYNAAEHEQDMDYESDIYADPVTMGKEYGSPHAEDNTIEIDALEDIGFYDDNQEDLVKLKGGGSYDNSNKFSDLKRHDEMSEDFAEEPDEAGEPRFNGQEYVDAYDEMENNNAKMDTYDEFEGMNDAALQMADDEEEVLHNMDLDEDVDVYGEFDDKRPLTPEQEESLALYGDMWEEIIAITSIEKLMATFKELYEKLTEERAINALIFFVNRKKAKMEYDGIIKQDDTGDELNIPENSSIFVKNKLKEMIETQPIIKPQEKEIERTPTRETKTFVPRKRESDAPSKMEDETEIISEIE